MSGPQLLDYGHFVVSFPQHLSSDFGSVRGLWQLHSAWSSELHPCSSSAVCQDSFHHLKPPQRLHGRCCSHPKEEELLRAPSNIQKAASAQARKYLNASSMLGRINGREGVDGASAIHERSKQTTTRVRSSILISF